MKQSPSWEAKCSSDCQKSFLDCRNCNAHYPIYDSQLVLYHPIYAQVFNISLFHQFFHQNTECICPCQTWNLSCPSHSSWLDNSSNTWRKLSIKKPLSFPLSYYLVPIMSKYLLQHPILESPQLTFLPQCDRPSYTEYKTREKGAMGIVYCVWTCSSIGPWGAFSDPILDSG